MNPEITNGTGSNGFVHSNPVDKLEGAFMSCLAAITKEDTLTNVDKDEIRVDVEQGLTTFIEQARSMEGYFLKKRLEIAAQKPELIIKDDASELRFELVRKDELLKKNYEKINVWQSILADLQSAGTQQSKATVSGTTVGVNLPQGPATPGAQGPLTPSSGRPNTPGSVGRPMTPVTSTAGSRMHTAFHSQMIKKRATASGFTRILPPHFSYPGMEQPHPNPGMSSPSLKSLLACPAPDIRSRLSEMLTRPVSETSRTRPVTSSLHIAEQQQQRHNMSILSQPRFSYAPMCMSPAPICRSPAPRCMSPMPMSSAPICMSPMPMSSVPICMSPMPMSPAPICMSPMPMSPAPICMSPMPMSPAPMLPFQNNTGAGGTRSCHISSVIMRPPPPPSPIPIPSTARIQYFYEQAGPMHYHTNQQPGVIMQRTNVPMQLNAGPHANPDSYPNNYFRFGRNQPEFPNNLPSCTKDKRSSRKK